MIWIYHDTYVPGVLFGPPVSLHPNMFWTDSNPSKCPGSETAVMGRKAKGWSSSPPPLSASSPGKHQNNLAWGLGEGLLTLEDGGGEGGGLNSWCGSICISEFTMVINTYPWVSTFQRKKTPHFKLDKNAWESIIPQKYDYSSRPNPYLYLSLKIGNVLHFEPEDLYKNCKLYPSKESFLT
jgi:hypothetical protein